MACMCIAVCSDGRTVRRVPCEFFLFKYYIDELNEYFTSSLSTPTEAYHQHLKWANSYLTPDGWIVERLVTPGNYNKFLVKDTGEIFYSRHMNIWDAYINMVYHEDDPNFESDDSGVFDDQ